MQSQITSEALEKLQKSLLGYMSSINTLLENEPQWCQGDEMYDVQPYKSPYANRLEDIKWEISQVEIHVSRLIKRIARKSP